MRALALCCLALFVAASAQADEGGKAEVDHRNITGTEIKGHGSGAHDGCQNKPAYQIILVKGRKERNNHQDDKPDRPQGGQAQIV